MKTDILPYSRHLAGINVLPQLIYDILHFWRTSKTIRLPYIDFPIDARLVSTDWQSEKQAFLLVFEHESFKAINPGDMIPILNPTFELVTLSINDHLNSHLRWMNTFIISENFPEKYLKALNTIVALFNNSPESENEVFEFAKKLHNRYVG